ncbi:histone-like nucleoid-structuring protein Lsr2 [Streptomyces sp. NPDC006872]|uniref:DUF2637 domain-containing protein n=1 Tax=Streptomyces sp. NPDC006872 TaxID=3155720 RepID=UPI0033F32345
MQNTDRAAAAMVAGIAAGAFTLSYEALRVVYLDSTQNDDLSVIYPLIVEGFVTVAVWVAYRLRDFGWRATAYPWILAGLFFAYSLWANSRPETVPGYVTRGVPSLAVPLAVHLFTHMVKRRGPVQAELVVEDEELPADAPWPLWEPPAVQAAMFSTNAVVANSVTDSGPLIRRWARTQGFEVKDTGRIPEHILQAYAKAHGGSLVTP